MSTVTEREDMSHNSAKLEVTIGMKLDMPLMSRVLWPWPMCRETERPVLIPVAETSIVNVIFTLVFYSPYLDR